MKLTTDTLRTTLGGAITAAVLCTGCAPSEPAADLAETAAKTEADGTTTSAEDAKQEIVEAAEAVADYTYAQREDFEDWARSRLDTIDSELTRLDGALEETDETVREQWSETMTGLRDRQRDVEQRFDSAMAAGEEAWAEIRSGFVDAQEELTDAVAAAWDDTIGEGDDPLADFTIGTDTNPQGVVHASDHAYRFVRGMVVHYSMRVEEAQPEARVTVLWTDDRAAVQERQVKQIGSSETLAFTADTTEWPAGHYIAEVWMGGERVDSQIFEVIDA